MPRQAKAEETKEEPVVAAKAAKGAKAAKEAPAKEAPAKATKGAKAEAEPAGKAKAVEKKEKKVKTPKELKAQAAEAAAALGGEQIKYARVKKHIINNINPEILQSVEDFKKKNEKILEDTKLSKLDEATVQKYLSALRFPVPDYKKDATPEQRAKVTEKAMKDHREAIKKQAEKDPVFKSFAKQYDVKQECRKLLREKIHFGKPAFVGVAAMLDEIVKSILTFGIDSAIEAERKRVDVEHCLATGIERTPYYALFGLTGVYTRAFNAALAAQAAKDRKAGEEAPEEEAVAEEEEDAGPSFLYYIRRISKNILMSNTKYAAASVGGKTLNFCADLVSEIVRNLAGSLRDILNVRKARTIKYDLIRATVSAIMKYNGQDAEALLTTMDTRVKNWTDSEAEKVKERAAAAKSGKAPAKVGAKKAADDDESSSSSSSSSSSDDE